MPKLLRIPDVDVDDDGEEVQPVRSGACQPKKGKRAGTFIPKETLEAWYSRFPGNAVAKVFFLLLTWSARYGKGIAFLSIEEIMMATGLSKRSVNYAISQLKENGFILREGRYRISIPDPLKVEAKVNHSKLRPRKVQHVCTFKSARLRTKSARVRTKGAKGVHLQFY
jgi:hypothetical protein